MRTTFKIPDDVLSAARQRAKAHGQTLGDALADLARKSLESELDSESSDFWRGVKFIPHRPDDPPVTLPQQEA